MGKKRGKHSIQVLKNHVAHEYFTGLKSVCSFVHCGVFQTSVSTKWHLFLWHPLWERCCPPPMKNTKFSPGHSMTLLGD